VANAVAQLQPRVVVACDLDMLLAGWLVKRRTGARLVYDAHELWVESQGSPTAVFRLLYGTTERVLIRKADLVVTVNALLADILAKQHRVDRPLVVMNGPLSCRASGPVDVPIRMLFQGGFGHNRGLTELVTAMGMVRGRATLSLQGFGGIEAQLREQVTALSLSDVVRFVEPVPPTRTVAAAAEHDVGVISSVASSANQMYSTPAKVFDYLGAGLAILSTDLPGVRVAAGTTPVLYLPVSDADTIAAAILELADDPDRVAWMKAAAAELGPALLWDSQMRPLLDIVAGWMSAGEAVRS